MTKPRTIEQDTPILPDVVARTIIEDVRNFTGRRFSREGMYLQALVERAAGLYLHSPSFRKKIRAAGNSGRDYLYAFMRHWYAGILMDNESVAVYQLRQAGVWNDFANGRALPYLPAEIVRQVAP